MEFKFACVDVRPHDIDADGLPKKAVVSFALIGDANDRISLTVDYPSAFKRGEEYQVVMSAIGPAA